MAKCMRYNEKMETFVMTRNIIVLPQKANMNSKIKRRFICLNYFVRNFLP